MFVFVMTVALVSFRAIADGQFLHHRTSATSIYACHMQLAAKPANMTRYESLLNKSSIAEI